MRYWMNNFLTVRSNFHKDIPYKYKLIEIDADETWEDCCLPRLCDDDSPIVTGQGHPGGPGTPDLHLT